MRMKVHIFSVRLEQSSLASELKMSPGNNNTDMVRTILSGCGFIEIIKY